LKISEKSPPAPSELTVSSRSIQRFLVLFICSVLIGAISSSNWEDENSGIYNQGEIALHNIRAPFSFKLEVPSTTDSSSIQRLSVKRGQTIVRAGDEVTANQEAILRILAKESSGDRGMSTILGRILKIFVSLSVTYLFFTTLRASFNPTVTDLIFVSSCLVANFLIIRLVSLVGGSLSFSFSFLDANNVLLLAPLAAAAILIEVCLSSSFVFFYTVASALILTSTIEVETLIVLLVVVGGMVGALRLKQRSRRADYIYGAAYIASINVLIVLAHSLSSSDLTPSQIYIHLVCAFIGGIASGIIAGGLVPILEYLGDYVTDVKLLELASLDRPLLRELSLQAPGTWNHSMIVGQIGEAAAEAVGANPILTRVGAYYHDIGKIKKPAYFIENQLGRDNRHEKLTPSMSALIIKSHVKEGVELAEKYRIPKEITDFITQHHGQSLIEYFYDKAVKEAEEGEPVDEALYRYPGPRPQTKEAGIIMLADSIEAASRTLSDPTPARIQGLVQKMINKVFASGELDECNLKLSDLHLIAGAFTRVLSGIYHRRIDYSEPAEKVKEKSEKIPKAGANGDLKLEVVPAGEDSAYQGGAQKTSIAEDPKEALKRLGSTPGVTKYPIH
jgi:putative nucleotidyltransferase with HDIG domain